MTERFTKMIFKTTPFFGKGQIAATIIILPLGLVAGVDMINQFINKDQHFIWIVLALIAFVGGYSISNFIPKWFKEIYTLEIENDHLSGYNVFNKLVWEGSIHEFVSLNKDNTWYNKSSKWLVFYSSSNKRVTINPSIDFLGYIYDFIILNSNGNIIIDKEFMKKQRDYAAYWSYTRTKPFFTKYDPEYFKWLLKKVEAQKKELKAKGILDKNAFYGDQGDVKAEKILSEINVI